MKIAAIVSEYNPFHLGHEYHIKATRAKGATHIAAIMSGNVVQRGEFSVFDKFTRAASAVKGGVDLVIELPAAYASAAAPRFAAGALSIVGALGCVEMLSFGSESADLPLLKKSAAVLSDERVAALALKYVKEGQTYPSAFCRAGSELYADAASVLGSPNDLLAIEYIKAATELGLDLQFLAVARRAAGHDDPAASGYSAMAVRKLIKSGGDISSLVPNSGALSRSPASGGLAAIETALLYRLRTAESLMLPDRADGVESRLLAAARTAQNLDELLTAARTKRYTAARIRRAALHAAIGVTDQSYKPIPYIRVLAANRRGLEILQSAKATASLPISSSLAELEKSEGRDFAAFESRVSDIYALTFSPHLCCGLDYTHKFELIE